MTVADLFDKTRPSKYPMDKECKKLWIMALRSGKYQQGTRFLRNGDKFCALGVLMDILSTKSWMPAKLSACIDENVFQNDGRIGQLSKDVQRKAHISRDDMVRISSISDRETPFLEIADWVEEMH